MQQAEARSTPRPSPCKGAGPENVPDKMPDSFENHESRMSRQTFWSLWRVRAGHARNEIRVRRSLQRSWGGSPRQASLESPHIATVFHRPPRCFNMILATVQVCIGLIFHAISSGIDPLGASGPLPGRQPCWLLEATEAPLCLSAAPRPAARSLLRSIALQRQTAQSRCCFL